MKILNFFIFLHFIQVDGDSSDWIGLSPQNIHSFVFSKGEFIYKGDLNDFRTDLGNTYYADLKEFRLTCDSEWMYFLIKFKDIDENDMDSIHVEISIGNPGDPTQYEWLGDDAELGLSKRALADRIIALHSTEPGNFQIELWDGGIWYAPPTPGYIAIINHLQNCIEARIALTDIADGGLTLPTGIRVSLATFKNVVGWNNDIDATEDIGGPFYNDAIDVMGGKAGIPENAWDRDLYDNKLNYFFDIGLKKNGDATDFTRRVDGDSSDWKGILPSQIHETLYSENEWIYRGDIGDMRTDPEVPDDSVFDLIEFRLTADSVNLYILARFYHMDFEQTQIAISLDSDSNETDMALSINGDDTETYLANPIQYSEREILLTADSVNHAEIFLYADDGYSWYTPPSPYKIVIDTLNKTLEARIQLVDLNIHPKDTIIISGATYDAAVQGIGNSPNGNDDPSTPDIEEGDMSVDYPVCDALDVIGGRLGVSQNAWDRELWDGDLDFYHIIYLENIIQALGVKNSFLTLENTKEGILIKYCFSSSGNIKILRKEENKDFEEIKRTFSRSGEYLDKDVKSGKTYTYILKSYREILGPVTITYFNPLYNSLKMTNLNSFYFPDFKIFEIFDICGRKRIIEGKGIIEISDFKKGIYFIKLEGKTYRLINLK